MEDGESCALQVPVALGKPSTAKSLERGIQNLSRNNMDGRFAQILPTRNTIMK